MDNTVGSLTQSQKSLIIGMVLGDGHLRAFSGRSNVLMEVNHSIKQKAYVDWKYQELKNVAAKPPKIRKGNGERIAYRFHTKQLPELTVLYKLFYREHQKVVPENISLDAPSLAAWFMDDGSRCRASDIYLNTQQFEVSDQEKLIKALKGLGLKTRLNKDKKYYRIRFLKDSIPRLRALLNDIIIPTMRYKIEL